MKTQYCAKRGPNVVAVNLTTLDREDALAGNVHYLLLMIGLAMLLVAAGATSSFAQVRSPVREHVVEGVPSYDVKSICGHTIDPTVESHSGCTADENDAHNQLAKSWSQYRSADRANCVATMTELPSYVELLTCLQMDRDLNNERAEQNAGTPADRSMSVPQDSGDSISSALPASSPSVNTPPATPKADLGSPAFRRARSSVLLTR